MKKDQLSVSDWFGLGSFLVAMLSLSFNVIQWRIQRSLEKDISKRTVAKMNAGYQALWRIAEICDYIRGVRKKNNDPDLYITHTYERVQEISGCVDTGRAVMNSICRDLVGRRLHYEAPWTAQEFVNNSQNRESN